MGTYREAYDRSLADPEGFWGDLAGLVDWDTEPTRVLDRDARPLPRWYPDGRLNTCHNALDRHVAAGHGDRPALVHDSPVTGTTRTLTYAQLLQEVQLLAGVLRRLGVGAGDRVVVYLPMVPHAVVAMLACARLGAVHSVVFGGFAARELAARVDDARPVVVLAASCGVEPSRVVPYGPLLSDALASVASPPAHVVLLQRGQGPADLPVGPFEVHDWADAVARQREAVAGGQEPPAPVPVAATDPLYVLYTSGTTGGPKGIVRDHGGHAVALHWSMDAVFDTRPGEVFWAASDVGWVVGHSYIVYAPLLAGCTTVLYEGKPVGTPDAGAFWRVVAEHGVTTLFCAPTALRAIRRADPEGALVGDHDLSSLRTLFCAGERLDPETWEWAGRVLGVPVVDNWWQTETGWPIAANLRGLEPMPLRPGSPSVPVPGYDVAVVDPEGREVPPGEEGAVVIRLPLPPGTMSGVWGDESRLVSSYLSAHPGSYLSGDGGRFDDDGYLYVLGRTDDVINVAGHRLSTGTLEAAVATHPDVAECAVVGVDDDVKGQVPRAFVVLKAGVDRPAPALAAEVLARVRDQVGPVASLRDVDVVAALPKTRSGKVLRRSIRGAVAGEDGEVPPTIEDPGALEALREQLAR